MFDNSVRLVGFVGKDAEVKTTKTQREFTVLSWRQRRLGKTKTATATSGARNGTSSSRGAISRRLRRLSGRVRI